MGQKRKESEKKRLRISISSYFTMTNMLSYDLEINDCEGGIMEYKKNKILLGTYTYFIL